MGGNLRFFFFLFLFLIWNMQCGIQRSYDLLQIILYNFDIFLSVKNQSSLTCLLKRDSQTPKSREMIPYITLKKHNQRPTKIPLLFFSRPMKEIVKRKKKYHLTQKLEDTLTMYIYEYYLMILITQYKSSHLIMFSVVDMLIKEN